MKAFWTAAPLLSPFASLSKLFGAPRRIEVTYVEGTGAEATVSFDHEGEPIDRLERWLLANGFGGDREHGWMRKPKTGPRALVELSRDPTSAREIVVLEAVEVAPCASGRPSLTSDAGGRACRSSSSARIALGEKTGTIDPMLARSTCVALLLVGTAQADPTSASAPR